MDILNIIPGEEIYSRSVIGIIFGILAIISAGLFFLSLTGKKHNKDSTMAIIVLLIFIMSFTVISFYGEAPTGEYHPDVYEAVITDPDYVIDAEKYKLIEKRGDIFILEEVRYEGDEEK